MMPDHQSTQPPAEAPNLRVAAVARLFQLIPEIAQDMTTHPAGSGTSAARDPLPNRRLAALDAAQGLPPRKAPEPPDCLGYMRWLLAGPTPEEAVTLAAYALEPRHAVWWGHECLQTLPDKLSEDDRRMLALSAAWCATPDEENRLVVLEAAMAAPERGPGVWVALAAGWSSGSIAPLDAPDVPCPPFLTGRALNAGILAALSRVPLSERRNRLAHFVSMADILARSA
jgi:hypothetical protein